MSINDLLEQGIRIEGEYDIEVWDSENYVDFLKGQNFELDKCEIEERYLNAEILYMYAKDGVLVFEIGYELE